MESVGKKVDYNKGYNQGVVSMGRPLVPPQSVELEEAVLGAMLVDKDAVAECLDLLEEIHFYQEKHQLIFRAILILYDKAISIDLYTVIDQLKKGGDLAAVGGQVYMIGLTQKVSSAAHIETHARIIVQNYILRELIKVSSNVMDQAYDDTTDVFDLLDFTETKLYDLTSGNLRKSYERADKLVQDAIEQIKELKDKKGMSGIPTGFTELDKLTSGWQKSDLIILAARPGMGKTAFVLSMTRNMAIDSDVPVGVFSLEMPSVQLIKRLIVAETGIPNDKLKNGNLSEEEWDNLYSKVRKLEMSPIFIDDTPALSVFDLRAKCRRMVSQHKVQIIIIDYLQLMRGKSDKSGNREQEISYISRNLKAIAKELNVPIIALSQLSRAVETRGTSKRPMLSDLRESGAIEQDADIVSFIYRPEYYKMEFWDEEDEEVPCAGQAEIIIAKHRNGALDNVRLRFVKEFARFQDLSDNDYLIGGPSVSFESKMNDNEGGAPAADGPVDPMKKARPDAGNAFGEADPF